MWLRKQSRKLYSTLPYKSWLNEVIILDWNRLLCKFEGIKSNNGYKFHSSYDSTPSIPDGTFGTSFYRCAGRRIAHCGPGLESSSQCVPSRRVAPQRKNDEHIGHNADESIIYSIRCINIYIYSMYMGIMGTKTIRIHFNNGGMLPMVSCEYRWKNCWGEMHNLPDKAVTPSRGKWWANCPYLMVLYQLKIHQQHWLFQPNSANITSLHRRFILPSGLHWLRI